MFENIGSFFKKIMKNDTKELVSDTTTTNTSKEAAKERLQLVLMQDRANVSADFLELMKQEIVDVIKKYIVVEEDTIDVRIINQENEDGTNGAPSLCANIPILNIRNDNKGEKFRKEQSASITKDIVSTQKVDDSSDNNSNDNVEIENDGLNKEDVEVEKEEIDEDIVKDNNEIELTIDESKTEEVNSDEDKVNCDELVNDESDLSAEFKNSELEVVSENILVDNAVNEENDNDEEDEDEDDDDDVTFDDLLKAAEEEEKMQKEAKELVENKVSPKPKSAARLAKVSKSTKSKSTAKTASKRKKTTKK